MGGRLKVKGSTSKKPHLQLDQLVHSFMGREQLNDPVRAGWALHPMCIFSGSKLNKFMNPAWGMAGCLAWWCVGCRSRQKALPGRDIRDAAPAPGLGGGANVDAGGPSLLNNSNSARVQKS